MPSLTEMRITIKGKDVIDMFEKNLDDISKTKKREENYEGEVDGHADL